MRDPEGIVGIMAVDGREIVLRYPRADDAPALLAYINELSREQSFILMQGEQLTLPQEETWLSGRLKSIAESRGIFLLAEEQNQVVGTTDIDRKPLCEGHVGTFGISVARSYRDMGLGTFMMRAVIDEAVRRLPELRIIELGVFANNDRGRHLYLREGFVEHGRLPNGILHRGEYVDHVLMHRVIERDT